MPPQAPKQLFYIPLENRGIKPTGITYTRLGSKNSAKRLWLEGLRLGESNFTPQTKLRITPIPQLMSAIIDTGGDQSSPNKVSGRKKVGAVDGYVPIIDINSRMLAETFGDIDLIRVMYYANRLVLQAHTSEMNALTAIEDLEVNAVAKRLTMGVIGVGGGVFCSAMKQGLESTGVSLDVSWVIDIENSYLQNAIDNCPAITRDTIVVQGDASHVETNLLTPINIFLVTNACTGASGAGKAKNKIEHAEEHESGGLMVLKTIEIIERYMPPVIWHENVIAYSSSASAALLRGKLKSLGYEIQEQVFGGEMGTLEDRRRSILCAVHPKLKMSMENVVPVMKKEARLRDVMDNVPDDSPEWKTYDYLTEKAIRDEAAGKNFRLQRLTGDEPKIGVLGAGLSKARSTEPFFIHPKNPGLFRLPRVAEHARFQKIPESLVANRSKTIAHEILGQSGSYALFTAIGVATGKQLNHQFNGEPLDIVKNEFDEDFAIGDADEDSEQQSDEGLIRKPESLSLF